MGGFRHDQRGLNGRADDAKSPSGAAQQLIAQNRKLTLLQFLDPNVPELHVRAVAEEADVPLGIGDAA